MLVKAWLRLERSKNGERLRTPKPANRFNCMPPNRCVLEAREGTTKGGISADFGKHAEEHLARHAKTVVGAQCENRLVGSTIVDGVKRTSYRPQKAICSPMFVRFHQRGQGWTGTLHAPLSERSHDHLELVAMERRKSVDEEIFVRESGITGIDEDLKGPRDLKRAL